VELHLGVVLNDVAVSLVLHLEEEVNRTKANSRKSTKKPQWLTLKSPFDDEVSKHHDNYKCCYYIQVVLPPLLLMMTWLLALVYHEQSSDKNKDGSKSSQARLQKWLGDLCILAGTPQDALEFYQFAIQELKV